MFVDSIELCNDKVDCGTFFAIPRMLPLECYFNLLPVLAKDLRLHF